MGQSSQNTSTSSTTAPGAAAQPIVQGITNQLTNQIPNSGITDPEKGAINQLTQGGQAGDPFANQVSNNANNLLNGGGATSQNDNLQGNLNDFNDALSKVPGAAPGSSTINSPEVQRALQAANSNVMDSVNGQFAAAGRQGSGYNQRAIAEGISQADAPIILNQANQDAQTQLAAAQAKYGAGNSTSGAITGNNQQDLNNRVAGTGQATQAIDAQNEGAQQTIASQELLKQIPAQDLGLLSQIGIPLAGLNTTTTGNSSTTNNPSLIQDIGGIAGALGSKGGVNGAGQAVAGSGILGVLGAL